jgi:glycosyltransferase involved in cell wall biosynthesis
LQTATHKIAGIFSKKVEQVMVITNRYPRSLAPYEKMDGVPVFRYLFIPFRLGYLTSKRIDLFLASLFFNPINLMRLFIFMRSFKPDVVNVHFPHHQIPFILFLRKYFSFRLVVSLHGDEILKWFDDKGLIASADKNFDEIKPLISILREADAVTACSKFLLEKTIQLVPDIKQKGYVTYNGVDLERFNKRTPYKCRRDYVFSYGRLTYRKGFDLLIDAFANIAQKYPELDLVLAGDGEQWQVLEAQVCELGLENRVVFFGRATPEKIVELLYGCRFVIIPSRNEPFGIVALEAMAAGKALLTTCVGGLPEIVDGTINCMVFPTTNALAGGLEEMLSTKNLEIIGKYNRKAVCRLSWENAAENYLKVFNGLKP